MSHESLAHMGKKTLTDLQILGCELLKNTLRQALPGPAGGAIVLTRLPSRY